MSATPISGCAHAMEGSRPRVAPSTRRVLDAGCCRLRILAPRERHGFTNASGQTGRAGSGLSGTHGNHERAGTGPAGLRSRTGDFLETAPSFSGALLTLLPVSHPERAVAQ